MKYCLLGIAATVALAQSVSSTFTTGLNGNRVFAPEVVTTDHQITELTRNLNGRTVPLEQIEDQVLRREGNTKVTQRIIRKFDANGQVALNDRQIIEEQTAPDGSTTHITTYRRDLNGREQEAERATTVKQVQGTVTRIEATLDRATINGSFETVEKRNGVTEKTNDGSRTDLTTYQRSANGGYAVISRELNESSRRGDETTEKRTLYQPFSADGQLRVTEQAVSKITPGADGSEQVQTTLYGSSWDGRVRSPEAGPQLREQDIVERKPGPGGSVVESLSVRRPSISDPSKLGPAMKISETVCTGNCGKQ